MATISPTHSATPSVQSMLLQSRIEQARREAARAESHARELRAQADDEQRKADQSNSTARQLSAQQPVANQRPAEPSAPQDDGASNQPTPKSRSAPDPTYQSALRTTANPPPVHVESPRSYQTVAIAKSISSFLAQAGSAPAASGGAGAAIRLSVVV